MSKDSFDQKYNNIDYKEKRIEAIKSYSYLLKNDLITWEQFNTIKQYISKWDRKIIWSANKIRSYAEIYINWALEDDEWLKISNKLTSH